MVYTSGLFHVNVLPDDRSLLLISVIYSSPLEGSRGSDFFSNFIVSLEAA